MIRRVWLSALLLAASAGTVAADCCPTNCCEPANQWSVFADYLYFKPSVDDTYFVIDSQATSTFPEGKRVNNDFDFHSGYRVGGTYSFCDCNRELLFSYSHLGFKQDETVTGSFLWGTVGRADFATNFENYSGSAKSELDYLYQRYDLLYSQQIYNCCKLDVNVQFGLEAADLKLNEDYTFINGATTGLVKQHSKAWGIGPQLGFGLGYDLYEGSECDCLPGTLRLNVLSTGSLLAADSKAKAFSSLTGVTNLNVKDDNTWRVIPALHARVGLDYGFNFSCFDFSLEVGYEFSSYIRGLTRIGFPDDVADGLSYSNYYNFDMQGLYVSGSFRF